MTVRVRFAPAPTGFLHLGSARAALFNWAVARQAGGTFVLRSDDTDIERSSPEFRDDIVNGLRWLGLDWDEGVEVGGRHGTYRQSHRLGRYVEVADRLVGDGFAYHDFCTGEEIDRLRAKAAAEHGTPVVVRSCDAISADETERRRAQGIRPAVRFEVPRPGETAFVDEVRGEVAFDHSQQEDFVILRSDGSPTYHLASTVDDVDYEISQVIRGEDLLPSTPKHIMLTMALAARPPSYAHLPLLHGPDGAKLSKRHGDTAVHAYRDAGFLPEAMVNYLALLGWSPGDDETIFDRAEIVERFDLGDVSRNPAVFDAQKLEWMNGVYIRAAGREKFVAAVLPLVEADLGRTLDGGERETLEAVAHLIQERAKLLTEVPQQVEFLFVDSLDYDEGSWQKVMKKDGVPSVLEAASAKLEELGEWTTTKIEAALRGMLDERDLAAGKGLQPIRVAVTGSTVSPPLFESLEALGRDLSLARLRGALDRLD